MRHDRESMADPALIQALCLKRPYNPPTTPPPTLGSPPPHRVLCSLFRAVLNVQPISEARTFSLFSGAKTLPNIVGWIKYPGTIFQRRISLAFSKPDLVIMEVRHHQSGFSEASFVCFKPALSLSPLKQFPVWHTRITIDWRLVLPEVCAGHRPWIFLSCVHFPKDISGIKQVEL